MLIIIPDVGDNVSIFVLPLITKYTIVRFSDDIDPLQLENQ